MPTGTIPDIITEAKRRLTALQARHSVAGDSASIADDALQLCSSLLAGLADNADVYVPRAGSSPDIFEAPASLPGLATPVTSNEQIRALHTLAAIVQNMQAVSSPIELLQCLVDGLCAATHAAQVSICYQPSPDQSRIVSASPAESLNQLKASGYHWEHVKTIAGWLPPGQHLLAINAAEYRERLVQAGLAVEQYPQSNVLIAPISHQEGQLNGLLFLMDSPAGVFSAVDMWITDNALEIAAPRLNRIVTRREIDKHAQELGTIFDALNEAVVVCDAEGKTTSANPAAVALCGPNVLTTYRIDLARELAFRHLDDQPYAKEALPVYRALRGEAVRNIVFVMNSAQGERRVLSVNATPLYTDGQLTGAVTIWHDITERDTMLNQLEAARARLATIIESAPEGIIVADNKGNVYLMNPAAVQFFGQEKKYNFYREQVLRWETTEGRPLTVEDMPIKKAAIDGLWTRNYEMVACFPNGQKRTILANAAPIFDPHKTLTGGVIIFQDITNRSLISSVLKRRVRNLRLLNAISRELAASMDEERVLSGVQESIPKLIPAVGSCIVLWDEAHKGWLVHTLRVGNTWVDTALGNKLLPGGQFWEDVARNRHSILLNDLADYRELAGYLNDWLRVDANAVLAVPVTVRGNVIGVVIAVGSEAGCFKPYDRMLLETLISAGTVALDNTRLLADARSAAIASERSRLARDLHDAVSQTLFSASLIAEALPRMYERSPEMVKPGLDQLQQLAHSALAEMRLLLVELRPSTMLETPLPSLVGQLAETMATRAQLQMHLDLEKICAVPPEAHVGLYRIAQEALNNTIKHARATEVHLSLHEVGGRVELRIFDNGRGFDKALITNGHLGLGIMQERAMALNMDLEVSSKPGAGTEIVARYPSNVASQEVS